MLEKKINLDKLIEEYRLDSDHWADQDFNESSIPNMLLEFGKQLLELATENVIINHSFDGAHGCEYKVDKQSILNTIKQIE